MAGKDLPISETRAKTLSRREQRKAKQSRSNNTNDLPDDPVRESSSQGQARPTSAPPNTLQLLMRPKPQAGTLLEEIAEDADEK